MIIPFEVNKSNIHKVLINCVIGIIITAILLSMFKYFIIGVFCWWFFRVEGTLSLFEALTYCLGVIYGLFFVDVSKRGD